MGAGPRAASGNFVRGAVDGPRAADDLVDYRGILRNPCAEHPRHDGTAAHRCEFFGFQVGNGVNPGTKNVRHENLPSLTAPISPPRASSRRMHWALLLGSTRP